jgi:hypothetical protein
MDALLIQLKLVGGDAVGCHQLFIRVAARAHGRLVAGIDLGSRIGSFEDPVPVVAVKAGGDVGIPLEERLAVLALPVLIELVGRQVKGAHEIDAGVARATEAGNTILGERAQIPCFGRHGSLFVCLRGIATVTAHTANTLGGVDTLFPVVCDLGVLAAQFPVTGNAGVLFEKYRLVDGGRYGLGRWRQRGRRLGRGLRFCFRFGLHCSLAGLMAEQAGTRLASFVVRREWL